MLHLPASIPGGRCRDLPCTVTTIHRARLSLVVDEKLSVGLAVSVEHEDNLLLGEVMSCHQDQTGEWIADLELEQVLNGLQSLMNLRARLLDEAPVVTEPAFAPRGSVDRRA